MTSMWPFIKDFNIGTSPFVTMFTYPLHSRRDDTLVRQFESTSHRVRTASGSALSRTGKPCVLPAFSARDGGLGRRYGAVAAAARRLPIRVQVCGKSATVAHFVVLHGTRVRRAIGCGVCARETLERTAWIDIRSVGSKRPADRDHQAATAQPSGRCFDGACETTVACRRWAMFFSCSVRVHFFHGVANIIFFYFGHWWRHQNFYFVELADITYAVKSVLSFFRHFLYIAENVIFVFL